MSQRIRRVLRAALVLSSAVASAPIASSQESQPLVSFFDEEGLAYFVEGRTPETLLATFECRELEFWLTQAMVAGWLAASGADPFDMPEARIVADDVQSPPFTLVELFGDEAMGGWRAVLIGPYRTDGFSGDDWGPIGDAGYVAIVTSAFEIPLTPAEGDPENRAAFVEACLAR